MSNGDHGSNLWNLLHLLWIGGAGAFWKLFSSKADKDVVDGKHSENIDRFDQVISKLEKISDTLTNVRIDVGRLKQHVFHSEDD